jgi:hypothetical protein
MKKINLSAQEMNAQENWLRLLSSHEQSQKGKKSKDKKDGKKVNVPSLRTV